MEALVVSRAEAGQKLLNFLERRVDNTATQLHKWIRTGQVRRNGARAKPFDRVDEHDIVRLPPFAQLRAPSPRLTPPGLPLQEAPTKACPADPTKSWKTTALPAENSARNSAHNPESSPQHIAATAAFAPALPAARHGLPVLWESEDLLVLNKPAGLPSQGGSGQTDSVADRLKHAFASADFVPAPAHRLDKDTSGLLLAAKSYSALRALTDALAGRTPHAPRKEYLAWVHGTWPWEEERELCDLLVKDRSTGRVLSLGGSDKGASKKIAKLADPKAAPKACDPVRPTETSAPFLPQHAAPSRQHVLPPTANTFPAQELSAQDPKPDKGQQALAQVKNLAQATIGGRPFTLLLVRLLTGRTHQIRVQLASRGYPVVGDRRYGHAAQDKTGLKLHAFRLSIPALPGLAPCRLECPPPWKAPWLVPCAIPPL